MKPKEVLKILEHKLLKIRNINLGGCGITTYYVAKALLDKNVRFDIVLHPDTLIYTREDGGYSCKCTRSVSAVIKAISKNNTYITSYHVCLKVGNFYFNRDICRGRLYYIRGVDDQLRLLEKLKNSYRLKSEIVWNDKYNVKNNSKIRNLSKYWINKLN